MGTHPIFESDFDCLTDMLTTHLRRLSGYSKKPSGYTSKGLTKIETLKAPASKFGIPKPEKGVLEVETGREFFGKKEIAIIESDQAMQVRIKDTRRMNRIQTLYNLTPIICIIILLNGYIYYLINYDDVPELFKKVYYKRLEEKETNERKSIPISTK